jgi:hypothetical protein
MLIMMKDVGKLTRGVLIVESDLRLGTDQCHEYVV